MAKHKSGELRCPATALITYRQGCHGQGKSLENEIFSRSGNLSLSQGKLQKVKKSWKSQGISKFSQKGWSYVLKEFEKKSELFFPKVTWLSVSQNCLVFKHIV